MYHCYAHGISILITGTAIFPVHVMLNHFGPGIEIGHRPPDASRVAVWLSEHLLGATFTVECEDASSVDGKRGYVIVCNHQSSLDAGAIHKLNLSGHIGPTRDRRICLVSQRVWL